MSQLNMFATLYVRIRDYTTPASGLSLPQSVKVGMTVVCLVEKWLIMCVSWLRETERALPLEDTWDEIIWSIGRV